jgi:hypothetical protein
MDMFLLPTNQLNCTVRINLHQHSEGRQGDKNVKLLECVEVMLHAMAVQFYCPCKQPRLCSWLTNSRITEEIATYSALRRSLLNPELCPV